MMRKRTPFQKMLAGGTTVTDVDDPLRQNRQARLQDELQLFIALLPTIIHPEAAPVAEN